MIRRLFRLALLACMFFVMLDLWGVDVALVGWIFTSHVLSIAVTLLLGVQPVGRAREHGGVDLKNSQANTDQCPVRFVPGRNPFQTIAESIGRMEGVPPCVDLRLSPQVGPIDYVLVWGAPRENLTTPCGAALAEELVQRYQPVFLSEPRGLLEVWRPRVQTAAR